MDRAAWVGKAAVDLVVRAVVEAALAVVGEVDSAGAAADLEDGEAVEALAVRVVPGDAAGLIFEVAAVRTMDRSATGAIAGSRASMAW